MPSLRILKDNMKKHLTVRHFYKKKKNFSILKLNCKTLRTKRGWWLIDFRQRVYMSISTTQWPLPCRVWGMIIKNCAPNYEFTLSENQNHQRPSSSSCSSHKNGKRKKGASEMTHRISQHVISLPNHGSCKLTDKLGHSCGKLGIIFMSMCHSSFLYKTKLKVNLNHLWPGASYFSSFHRWLSFLTEASTVNSPAHQYF